MKTTLSTIFVIVISSCVYSQVFTTNTTPSGMEHNVLFSATSRYSVTQQGTATLNLYSLFDGKFNPSYTSVGPSVSSPTIVLIEGLPNMHTQTGAWVGWSTRFWESKRFKIEGYDTYNGNVWKVIADYSNDDYTGGRSFTKKIPSSGVYTKLRFTFYTAVGLNGRLGVSELFFIHPEAVTPYQGLLDRQWSNVGNKINYSIGNVGIGSTDPSEKLEIYNSNTTPGVISLRSSRNDASYVDVGQIIAKQGVTGVAKIGMPRAGGTYTGFLTFWTKETNSSALTESMRISEKGNVGIGVTDTKGFKLGVNGKIATTEVKVAPYASWSDFVFEKKYELPSLIDVEKYIKKNGHLKDIPSAEEVGKNGFFLAEMDSKLLQKIEELTLYTIQQQKEIQNLKKENSALKSLKSKFKDLLERLENLEKKQ